MALLGSALNAMDEMALIKSPLKNSILAGGIAAMTLLEIYIACAAVSAGI